MTLKSERRQARKWRLPTLDVSRTLAAMLSNYLGRSLKIPNEGLFDSDRQEVRKEGLGHNIARLDDASAPAYRPARASEFVG